MRLAGIVVVVAATALSAAACGGMTQTPVASLQPLPPSTSHARTPSESDSASAPATPPASTTTEPPVDPGTLPQTHTLPTSTDPVFQAGVEHLWQAIVDDDPAEAQPFFFPQTAYVQVKAIKNAVADYQNRLIGFYDLDIHAAHKLLGADAKTAKLVSVTVPTNQAQWIAPGVEQNKESYYRVYGSRLTYQVGGRTKSFGLFSLISWRGVWYVVHLGPNPRPKAVGTVYQPKG